MFTKIEFIQYNLISAKQTQNNDDLSLLSSMDRLIKLSNQELKDYKGIKYLKDKNSSNNKDIVFNTSGIKVVDTNEVYMINKENNHQLYKSDNVDIIIQDKYTTVVINNEIREMITYYEKEEEIIFLYDKKSVLDYETLIFVFKKLFQSSPGIITELKENKKLVKTILKYKEKNRNTQQNKPNNHNK